MMKAQHKFNNMERRNSKKNWTTTYALRKGQYETTLNLGANGRKKFQQCWELLANYDASVCTGLETNLR